MPKPFPIKKIGVFCDRRICAVGLFLVLSFINNVQAQNSMTGDGFGGRSWYVAHNYQVGAYTGYTVCGVNNQLYAWGGNLHGELGIGTTVSNTLPVAVPGMTGVKFYSTGYLSGVIKNNNTAWIWGVLNDQNGPVLTPNPTQVLSNVKFIDAGLSHVVFVKNDGTVWGAGKNYKGELGNGSVGGSAVFISPVQMTGINNAVRAIALGGITGSAPASLILLADSTVKITGGDGQFTQTVNHVPVTMPGLNNIIDIKGNNLAAFALNATGEVYAFGKETIWGSLGLGLPPFSYSPPAKVTFPAGAAPIVALSSNNDGFTTLALDENRNLYAWGMNEHGELGDGTYISRNSPKLVATGIIDIYAGELFTYILKADLTLWATGKSGWGIGYGSIWLNLPNIMRNVFTQLDPISPPVNLCASRPYGNVCTMQANLGSDISLCAGQKIVLNPGISNANYRWQDNSADSTYTVSSPGRYWVTVNMNGCISSDTINISYKPLPVVNLGKDTSLCFFEKLELNVSQANASYLWHDNSIHATYTVTKPGTYRVRVTVDGCESSDTLAVGVKDCDCEPGIPNAFTPNHDGFNDRWMISKGNCIKQVDVYVYNRYGGLVYQKENYQNDWEGTYKQKPLADATYYYVIKALRYDLRGQVLKGSVTILR